MLTSCSGLCKASRAEVKVGQTSSKKFTRFAYSSDAPLVEFCRISELVRVPGLTTSTMPRYMRILIEIPKIGGI